MFEYNKLFLAKGEFDKQIHGISSFHNNQFSLQMFLRNYFGRKNIFLFNVFSYAGFYEGILKKQHQALYLTEQVSSSKGHSLLRIVFHNYE